MSNETIYAQLCASYYAIDDFRMKLLGMLPLASGGILAFLIDDKKFALDHGFLPEVNDLLPFIGTLGFLATLGLFAFEIFGIRICTSLICVGAYLERQLGKAHGQFSDHPDAVLNFIAEPLAAGIIYPAVMAARIYVARFACDRTQAKFLAGGVFSLFFMLTLWFIRWLETSQGRNRRWPKRSEITPQFTGKEGNAFMPTSTQKQTAQFDHQQYPNERSAADQSQCQHHRIRHRHPTFSRSQMTLRLANLFGELPRYCGNVGTRGFGLDVRLVQLWLSNRGADIKADGIFGQTSVKRLAEYQSSKGLPATGVAAPALIAQLVA